MSERIRSLAVDPPEPIPRSACRSTILELTDHLLRLRCSRHRSEPGSFLLWALVACGCPPAAMEPGSTRSALPVPSPCPCPSGEDAGPPETSSVIASDGVSLWLGPACACLDRTSAFEQGATSARHFSLLVWNHSRRPVAIPVERLPMLVETGRGPPSTTDEPYCLRTVATVRTLDPASCRSHALVVPAQSGVTLTYDLWGWEDGGRFCAAGWHEVAAVLVGAIGPQPSLPSPCDRPDETLSLGGAGTTAAGEDSAHVPTDDPSSQAAGSHGGGWPVDLAPIDVWPMPGCADVVSNPARLWVTAATGRTR
jgi:hypothetical protein